MQEHTPPGSAALATTALTAFALLAWALARHRVFYGPWAIVLAFLALVVAGVGLRFHRSAWLGVRSATAFPLLLTVLLASTVLFHLTHRPALELGPEASLGVFRVGIVAVGLVVLSYAWPRLLWAHLRFPMLVALYAVLGGWVITASPAPHIDTWYFHQRATRLLLAGENPYEAEYPNIYTLPQAQRFYGEGRVRDGRLQYHYNYPPLSILAMVLGVLAAGDVRWSLLAATIGAVLVTRAACRRLGAPLGHPAELALAALLFHPQGFFVLEMAWSEPLLVLAVAAVLWTLTDPRAARWRSVALAGVLAVKQYGVLSFLAVWATQYVPWRAVVSAVAVAGAVTLPFLLWGPRSFLDGVVFHLWNIPARPEALALAAILPEPVLRKIPHTLLNLAGAGAALSAGALLARYSRQSLSAVLLFAATVHLAFFLFNKFAFTNYYWFIGALLAFSAAVEMAEHAAGSAGFASAAPSPATSGRATGG